MNSEELTRIVAVISACISVLTAIFSWWAFRKKRDSTKWTNRYTRLLEVEGMLEKRHQLLTLHGITPELLEAHGTDPAEVIYVLMSFRATQESHRLEPKESVVLSEYRKHMLNNQKVARIWRCVLRGRLLFPDQSGFVSAIDRNIESNYHDSLTEWDKADG